MEHVFEQEIWPDTKKMKMVYVTLMVVAVLAWLAHFAGDHFWDEYSHDVVNLRGVRGRAGWPVTLYWWGIYLGVLCPVGAVLVYFMQDKKNPALGLNRNGLFISQQLIRQTLVPWSNVQRIDKLNDNGRTVLEIYFKNADMVVEQQTGTRKAFVKENLKDGKPLRCEDKLITGDLNAFYTAAEKYMGK